MINLQKAILYATGRNLPIAGGMGLSIDDPVIVTENHHGLAVETERFAAREICVLYGWWQAEFGRIALFKRSSKNIEEFVINCVGSDDGQREEKLYFDITEGHKNIGRTLEQVKTRDELEKIHNNTYYSSIASQLPRFYGAFTYARTLKAQEHLDTVSLRDLLHVSNLEAQKLLDALEECGFDIVN